MHKAWYAMRIFVLSNRENKFGFVCEINADTSTHRDPEILKSLAPDVDFGTNSAIVRHEHVCTHDRPV